MFIIFCGMYNVFVYVLVIFVQKFLSLSKSMSRTLFVHKLIKAKVLFGSEKASAIYNANTLKEWQLIILLMLCLYIYIFFLFFNVTLQICHLKIRKKSSITHFNFLSKYRQGSYRYKKGTTAVLKTEVKKIPFEVVKKTVRAEPMETV